MTREEALKTIDEAPWHVKAAIVRWLEQSKPDPFDDKEAGDVVDGLIFEIVELTRKEAK